MAKSMARALDKVPQLGSKPVNLSVKIPAPQQSEDALASGLRDLYMRGQFTDVSLICAEQTFGAHRCVLAARSQVFREGLEKQAPTAAGERQEVRLAEVANPEAVKFMLDFVYESDASVWEDYNPRTQEIIKDVLRLAQNFQLEGLTERAIFWLSKDINTGNVVERLAVCDEFNLNELREKILSQLTMNKIALAEVASSPEIMKYPKLMQALLQQAANVPDEPQAKKKGRKA
mmetsp:Transcript_21662/g.39520  ORF Transcript_21662/g.39520 Transcript_21662/m.39520 type:complete len:232 (+) Transcript_21662:69-764(+)